MRYVDAGYIAVLSTLFAYGLQLLWRRRRLERVIERIGRSDPEQRADRPEP